MSEKNEKENKEKLKDENELEDEEEEKNLEKFKINYLSFPTSFPNTKLKSLCPMCTEIPNIYLSLDSENGHYVKCKSCRYCYCCSQPKAKSLEAYICIMSKIQQENIKCEIDKEKGIEKEGFFSCEKCQKWMCVECINEHIKTNKIHNYYIIQKYNKNDYHTHCVDHDLKEFDYYYTNSLMGYHVCESCEINDDYSSDYDFIRIPVELGFCYVTQLKEIIKNGVEYLDNYCKNIYDNLIKSINSDELLKKAKKIYDDFLIRNRRVLFYYQMAINAATPSIANYNLIENIGSLLNTKFEKIEIPLSKNFNKKEVDKILDFFEKNYIVGKETIKIKDIKEFTIKEISSFKNENIKEKNKKQNENEKKKNINYINIIILEDNLVCACTNDGFIHIFEIDKQSFKGKIILSEKVHENIVVGLDNFKNTKNKFVTCDEKEIKIWKIFKKNNIYNISCETTLKNLAKNEINFVLVLSNDEISYIKNENNFIKLDSFYKEKMDMKFQNCRFKGIYQIESNDEHNNLIILGQNNSILLYDIYERKNFEKIVRPIKCGCFCGKSFYYLGNDKLLIGDSDIYLVDIKQLKIEYVIKIGKAEISCFFKFKDFIFCSYGDTSNCSYWSNGIAQEKTTKFCALKKNNEKIESINIEDSFNNFGIIDSLWFDKDKLICCFYKDENIKIFQIK